MNAPLDLLIVGAGPAGLCAAAAARERGWEPRLLERAREAGGLWKRVPADMRCLSPRRRDLLPDGRSPQGPGDRATAAEVVAALDAFAAHAAFDLRLGRAATALRRGGDGVLEVDVADAFDAPVDARPVEVLRARRVLLATGEYGRPRIPALPGRFDGRLEHSAGVDFESLRPGERVVVVGSGNSAADLLPRLFSRRCEVVVSTRRPISRPAPALPGPLDRLMWRASGLPVRLLPPRLRCADTLGALDPVLFDARQRCRIRAVGEAVGLEAGGLVARDVGLVPCDRIVFCTGFKRDLAWTGLDLDERGVPAHRGGLSTERAGVAFLGLRCLRTRRSQFLRGLWADARAVVGGL